MGKRSCTVEKMGRVEGNYLSIIRVVCFVIILVAVLRHVFYILRFKNFDGIYNFEKFYLLEDNSVDVLVLGSSHAFETFNTGYLYENYGMAGYVLGGSAQPIWNTYYYLKEALKTQRPKVIVLEGFSLVYWQDDCRNESFIIKNTYGLKPSMVKFENMAASIPDEGKFTDYFPEYIQSHSRYSELGKKDFVNDQGNIAFYKNWHGFNNSTETTPCEMVEVDGYTNRAPLFSKSEQYFRRILELANEESIPIIVVIVPYAEGNGMSPEHQMKYNTVKDIADEYGVDFINFNSSKMYEEIGFNFKTDFNDEGAHLNHRGNVKVSKYVAEYILTMVDMPDRRGDPQYISWELEATYINASNRDRALTETKELKKIMEILDEGKYIYFVSHNTSESSEQIDNLKKYLGLSETVRGGYLVDSTSGEIMRAETAVWYELEGVSFMFEPWQGINIKHSKFHPENGNIDYMQSLYHYTDRGMLIVVYDSISLEIVDSFYIDEDDSINVRR